MSEKSNPARAAALRQIEILVSMAGRHSRPGQFLREIAETDPDPFRRTCARVALRRCGAEVDDRVVSTRPDPNHDSSGPVEPAPRVIPARKVNRAEWEYRDIRREGPQTQLIQPVYFHPGEKVTAAQKRRASRDKIHHGERWIPPKGTKQYF